MLEADCHLNLDFKNSKRKLCFDNSRLSIHSQHLAQSSSADETTNGIQFPHFRSIKAKETSTRSLSGDSTPPGLLYENCPSSPDPDEEFKVEVDVSDYSQIIDANCIVKHVAACLMIENDVAGDEVMWKSDWVGTGSLSGLDFTVSLSEIQVGTSFQSIIQIDFFLEITFNFFSPEFTNSVILPYVGHLMSQ